MAKKLTMTDREMLMALLGVWRVPYEVNEDGDVKVTKSKHCSTVTGYDHFYTLFEFRGDDGSFECMGAWE